jgi:large conductance mechanosensitive channel
VGSNPAAPTKGSHIVCGAFFYLLIVEENMWADFRAFIARGNVIDLAVGIIIGAAFTGVVNSLVNQIIMPPIGLIVGGVDFSNIAIVLREAVGEEPAVTIGIGDFINSLVNFLIVAVAVFFLVRGVTGIMELSGQDDEADAEPEESEPTDTELMLEELKAIRKALEEQ